VKRAPAVLLPSRHANPKLASMIRQVTFYRSTPKICMACPGKGEARRRSGSVRNSPAEFKVRFLSQTTAGCDNR
jgi:hypothetical protein